jgi:predicted  nucleic acid-binding Zn-ribbon protein
MDLDEDYDDKIAALEAKLCEADKTRKDLERDKSHALEDVDRASSQLWELEADVSKKKKEMGRLRETIDELTSDLRDERQTTSDMTDKLQKAWADYKNLQVEYGALARARDEAEARHHATQEQLGKANEQLQKMQAELNNYGELHEAAVDAERAQAELHSEIAVLHELGYPEQRKIIILTERNTVLENENSTLARDNKFLKRAIQGQHGTERLAQLDAMPSLTDSSLAEELVGHDYEDDNVGYESDSTVDPPIEMSCVATQTENLSPTTTSCATQSDAPWPTVAISTQTDDAEAKAVSTVSTQTDNVEAKAVSTVSTQTDTISPQDDAVPKTTSTSGSTYEEMLERTDKMDAMAGLLSKEVKGDFFIDGPPMLVALVLTFGILIIMRLVEGLKRTSGDSPGHDYGYGYGYGHMQGSSGAYGNGRYLFNVIPIAMELGSLSGLTGFSSRVIARVENWTGSEPELLY